MKTFQNPLRQPLRLLALTTLLALTAGALQTANAAPGWDQGGARYTEHMLDSVNASAEQRVQIQQIMDAAREAGRSQREQTRALRAQSAALFAQPTVDARAAEVLRQQMLAQHDQASKRHLQTMLDISRVLSPEQRQKLAERMQQRRAMMERHRSERDGLAGSTPR